MNVAFIPVRGGSKSIPLKNKTDMRKAIGVLDSKGGMRMPVH